MYSTSEAGNGPASAEGPISFVSAIRRAKVPLLGTGLTIPSIFVAQLVAETPGSDFVMIDMEHTPLSAETATNLVHAVAAASARAGRQCYSLVRVPSDGVEWIKWALDSGASGIIIPMVNNAAEMKQIIDRAVYPPRGRRSFGPMMASLGQPAGSGGTMGYFERARRGEVAILPMIESLEGVENVDSIMAVEGVSGVFIGPFDLRLALGLPGGLDGDEPAFVQALEKACAASKRLGKVTGSMGVGAAVSAKRTKQGMNFLVSSADSTVIQSGVAGALADSRKGIEQARTEERSSL